MLAWGCFVENKEKAAHECLTFLAYKAPFISSDPDPIQRRGSTRL